MPGAWTRQTHEALHANVAATRPNTAEVVLTESSNAAIAGPTNEPTLSNVLEETFAAASSSGVRASVGSSADSAGRKTVPMIEVQTASA